MSDGSTMRVLPTRLPEDLIKEVDSYAARERKESRGARVTRSDAIRMLINRGLAAEAEDERALRPKTLGELASTIDFAAARLPHTTIPNEPPKARAERVDKLTELRERLRGIVHELMSMDVMYASDGRIAYELSPIRISGEPAPTRNGGRQKSKRAK